MTNGAEMKTIRLAAMAAVMIFGTALVAGATFAQSANSAASSDDDMKLMALEGLQHADTSVAVPQIEKFLASNASINMKKRALSILARQDSTQAREALGRIAK